MNYEETLKYLYESVPMFQREGKSGYKEGLSNTIQMDAYFKHPHRNYKTIHVAGTNGKGSCSHTIAAILQTAGYKVGLYTSPHLVDFRERIKINGEMMEKDFVVDFITQNKAFFQSLQPSFFELTTAMAFYYFSSKNIDVAIIEVGLGGRLDCTNIITPQLSVITNISLDHTQFLGHTLSCIAAEKGGIIKANIPVIIGESTPETMPIFRSIATQKNSEIYFCEEQPIIKKAYHSEKGTWIYTSNKNLKIQGELNGLCQLKNTNTILKALEVLQKKDWKIKDKHIQKGFNNVCKLTGLMGRWQVLQESPKVICDTGHNVAGIQLITQQLKQQAYRRLFFIIGMVNDKDIDSVLNLLPIDAHYLLTQANINRALPLETLETKAKEHHLTTSSYKNVDSAIEAALQMAQKEDLIFIGGSTFVVAEALENSFFKEK
jgi:dihydrofolate synthase/folylpolyglutamate synthase